MYKLKHIPTGLYYQPHKHRGSNLSKRGKVYQTGTHGLSSAYKYAEKYPEDEHYKTFSIYCEKDSQIYKQTMNILHWEDCKWAYNQVKATTNLSDWIIENI